MKSLSKNNHHVVKLFDVIYTQHNIYIVFEYCNGGDLKDYIQKKGKVQE